MKRDVEAITVRVTALGGLGDGVARLADGQVMLVPDGVPGDVLRVLPEAQGKGLARGRIAEVLEPSPQRVEPPCPVFGRCGGCTWQQLDVALQRREKLSFVHHALGRSVDVQLATEPVPPLRHRRRVRLHLRRHGARVVVGMMARASHEVVDIADCVVLTEALAGLLGRLPAACADWLKMGEAYAVEGAEGVLLSIHGLPLEFDDLPRAATLQAALGIAGVTLQLGRFRDQSGLAEVTLPETVPSGGVASLPVRVDAGGFCQATEAGNRAIRAAVVAALDAVGPVPRIQEFYAGSGNLSVLCLGRSAPLRLRTVEQDEAAVARARRTLDGIDGVECFCGDADELADQPVAGELWLLDPGRQGAKALVQQAATQHAPAHIVYVSCAMDTLRRDVQILTQAGYRVVSAVAIDAFPHTPHVEAVVRLQRA